MTPRCIPLDHRAYPSTVFDREIVPWPNWCCKAPDGGVHIDARVAAIDEARAPRLLSSEGWSKVCPVCGYVYATLHGKVFFADPAVQGRPLIITSDGIFVGEDEAIRRQLRTPTGAYKPTVVELRRGDQAVH
jgi:hypothetical protein